VRNTPVPRPEQPKRYSRHGIAAAAVRLEDHILPFSDVIFNVIIMREVLERKRSVSGVN
jgi:hypothetical protein